SFKVDYNTMKLTMANGGSIIVPLARVDRIIDDEIATPEVVAEVKKIVEEGGVFPHRSWRYNATSGPIFKTRYDKIIIEAARKFDVDAALISAIIKAESDFNPREVSNKGARGLMQLMPSTADRFGVRNSFDAKANINGGVQYLRWLLDTFSGNADFAVAAYNAGGEVDDRVALFDIASGRAGLDLRSHTEGKRRQLDADGRLTITQHMWIEMSRVGVADGAALQVEDREREGHECAPLRRTINEV